MQAPPFPSPSLSLSSLSLFGLCEPLSPGLERPSLPILDNCESLLIGLQCKRITWARNDVMARGPSHRPPPLTSPIKTKSSSTPNVLETTGLTLCSVSCMRAPGQTSVYVYRERLETITTAGPQPARSSLSNMAAAPWLVNTNTF